MKYGSSGESSQTVIQLNQSQSEHKVFCLHTAGGGVSFYKGLANELSDMAAFIGLEDPVLHRQFNYRSLSELAYYHSNIIQAQQPSGPYYLMGYCSGGPLAFETAYQLESQGKEVAGLALFGEHIVGFDSDERCRYQFLAGYLRSRFNLSLPSLNWVSLESKSIDEVVEIVAENIGKTSLPGIKGDATWIKKGLRALLLSRIASRQYQPQQAGFNVDLYQRHVNWEKVGDVPPWCNWEKLTRSQLRTIVPPPIVDGQDDILFPPYLLDTAQKVRALTLHNLAISVATSKQGLSSEYLQDEQAHKF
ncbi:MULTISPECIES: thioesterase domain-containing protein [unclassified Pseudoalteromonas]|uniref:thioesterase domain-containing protein n=1 Tax=unclassified Pseudoalteromonas TaxID=194690 RepID=UPI0003F65022|nr:MULTISPECIES: thioesterase domain-containing protein [unclassified Pseudoalteromonas]PCC14201.1 hypothetical protein CIK86_13660 [Pseudoalteromonas sp. JB197]SJN16517.1 putative non-ribosomal peptide synthetase [Pseudoalteromonas sp. JB197]